MKTTLVDMTDKSIAEREMAAQKLGVSRNSPRIEGDEMLDCRALGGRLGKCPAPILVSVPWIQATSAPEVRASRLSHPP